MRTARLSLAAACAAMVAASADMPVLRPIYRDPMPSLPAPYGDEAARVRGRKRFSGGNGKWPAADDERAAKRKAQRQARRQNRKHRK